MSQDYSSDRFIGTAPAKVILFGEHAVVYGQPAIAIPVSSLRAQAVVQIGGQGLKIEAPDLLDTDEALIFVTRLVFKRLGTELPNATIMIHSQIPVASGLGSGAAVSTALSRALVAALHHSIDSVVLNEIVYEVEKIHHGTPSGVDNTVIVYERPVYFVRNHPIEILEIAQPFSLLIADTGKSALTRVAVAGVRKLYDTEPEKIQLVLNAIGSLVINAREKIERGDIVGLGSLMIANHDYLKQLTVSSPELDTLVNSAMNAGALGAKLSGGGRGGNMIALVNPEESHKVADALRNAGAIRVFETKVSPC